MSWLLESTDLILLLQAFRYSFANADSSTLLHPRRRLPNYRGSYALASEASRLTVLLASNL